MIKQKPTRLKTRTFLANIVLLSFLMYCNTNIILKNIIMKVLGVLKQRTEIRLRFNAKKLTGFLKQVDEMDRKRGNLLLLREKTRLRQKSDTSKKKDTTYSK